MAEIAPQVRAILRKLLNGESPWPLYLWGPAGTGKTSAALVVLDYCGRNQCEHEPEPEIHDWIYGFAEVRSITSMRIAADKGLGSIGASYFGLPDGCSAWAKLVENWKRLPLCVLDEIGVGSTASDFRLDALLEVLNTRCDHPVKPLIVTSNLEPKEIEKAYDDRVASRILAGTVHHVGGYDRRITKGSR